MKAGHPEVEVSQTLFAVAEYIVNSRPLTHVSTDTQDSVNIFPNAILIGNSLDFHLLRQILFFTLKCSSIWSMNVKFSKYTGTARQQGVGLR